MGAQWKQKGKEANSAAKGKIMGKLAKEIMVAARGGPDPAMNAKLRMAVEAAKKASMTKDTLERAIKKGAGLLDEAVNFETVVYEGFAPHQVPIIVECLTENRNRTSGDIRNLFKKGTLGASGSVAYMFNHVGLIVATPPAAGADMEEAAIEAGAQEVEKTDDGVQFVCEKADLVSVTKALQDKGWQVQSSEFAYVPKDPVEVSGDARKEVDEFLTNIDDNDDVHRLFPALKS